MAEIVVAPVEEAGVEGQGWFFVRAAGRKYTTKKDEIGSVALKLQGQVAEIEFVTKTREANGRTYTNYYMNRIRPADVGGADTADSHPSQPVTPASVPDAVSAPPTSDRDTQIHRQTASKVAVQMLPLLEPSDRTFDTLILLSERLVRYYANGPER